MDWASLPADLLFSISSHLREPEDFVRFRAVCPQWRAAVSHEEHAFFQPWIMASRWHEDEYSENFVFYSLSTLKTIKVCVPDMKGKRVAASGSGHLVAIDNDDDLSAVLVNPLSGKTMALPRLPEFFHDNGAHGWVTGEGVITVVLYNWMSENMALWYRGGGITMKGWAVVPRWKLRLRMSYYLRMLAVYGDQMEMHLTDLGGDNEDSVVLLQETEKVELLGGCWPGSDELFKATTLYHHEWFSLYRNVEQEEIPVHDIGNAMVVQSRDSCTRTYMIPASRDFAALSSRNAFYYLWKQFDAGGSYNALFKKCLASEELTFVKRLPEDWKLSDEWFMPSLKY
uniref:F-box domain-containing protein n=1 Tax=Oryza meridionalis TaxID=40149 RepID=A0A0E0C311_9ORYZ